MTAIVIFLQIALGGLLTFNFITPESHILTGLLVLILAIGCMVFALVSKPAFRPLQGLSVALVVLIVIQAILGFATLSNGSQVIAWIHLVNAIAIYGMALSGTFMAMRWDRISATQPAKVRDQLAQIA